MKAAIYCRLSEEDRGKQLADTDSESIQNQKTMLLSYAMEQGWEIAGIYSDDDYAGADRSRPAFCRLLRDAEARRFDIVLCKTQSRFTRELELVEKYIHGLFPIWGIRFISIVDNADTANKGNKKSRQINGLVNEWYLEDMSDSIKSVLDTKRRNGRHIGSFALYGYRKDPDRKGGLLIDEQAAAVVREVFTLFAQGHGKTAIARMLNERGVPNPTEYKHRQGLRYQQPKNSTLWKYTAISRMLTNEIYLGHMVQGKYGSVSYKSKVNRPRPREDWFRVEDTHEAIIDLALWNRVQTILKQRTKPFSTGEIGVFAQKARCAGCGAVLRSTQSNGRRYLKCPNHGVSPTACTGAFIAVDRLEQAVLSELRQLIDRYLDAAALACKLTRSVHSDAQEQRLQATKASCEKKCAAYAKNITALYLDKANGILTEQEFITISAQLRREQAQLVGRITDCTAKLAQLQQTAKTPRDAIAQYVPPSHLSRTMVELLIDHIAVGRREPGTSQLPITIYWNF